MKPQHDNMKPEPLWKGILILIVWPILQVAALSGIIYLVFTKCFALILVLVCFIPWLGQALNDGSNMN